jgi:hypothetical protein
LSSTDVYKKKTSEELLTLYHPQSNLCERVNRTLKPLLAALAHNDDDDEEIEG